MDDPKNEFVEPAPHPDNDRGNDNTESKFGWWLFVLPPVLGIAIIVLFLIIQHLTSPA